MKKFFLGVFFALILISTSSPTYAAAIQIKIDGFTVPTDVKPEINNNHTMVPLRVISESLGAKVHWSNTEVTLMKGDTKVILKINSNEAVKNGKTVILDAKPYIKNNRVIVPLRFIAEAFGSQVGYKNAIVTVDNAPLMINGIKVKALQEEYHMIMGGVIQQIHGNAFIEEFYNIIEENKSGKVVAPDKYSWQYQIDEPVGYYKWAQYDFLNQNGNSIKRVDMYNLIPSSLSKDSEGHPEYLIHDVTENQWYLFSGAASKSLQELIERASQNGFRTIISNTVV